ncbi:MAG: TolC family protein [Phycisphaerales bacterium]|nr:TolC family protein [Phycisphaerales bacterium]
MPEGTVNFFFGRGTWSLGLLVTACLISCESPFPGDQADRGDAELSSAIESVLARQGASPRAASADQAAASHLQTATQLPNDLFETLKSRMPELDSLGPQTPGVGIGLDLGPDVSGTPAREVGISLRNAISASVRNNLSVQSARIEESIVQADVVKAEAAFDAVLLASTGYQVNNIPPPPLNLGGLDNAFTKEDTATTLSTGIQKRLISGGTVSASFDMEYTQQATTSIYDPANYWTNSVNFNISQPLLQGFGSDVNEAQIRIARNQDRVGVLNLRQTLLDTVRDTEVQYWSLLQTRQQVVAAAWLVKVGGDVRDILKKRLNFDATVADYSLAVAIVEVRRANLIRAWLASRDASDRLKLTLNDPAASVGSDALLVPVDRPVLQPISYNLRDAIVTSVEQNPSIARSILAIDDAAIRLIVADNGRLPQLGLQAGVTLTGQDNSSGTFGSAMSEINNADFVSWLAQMAFSQPIGNRAAEAEYRKARLRRSSAVISYQQAIENAVFAVKVSLRSVTTSYELIEQSRASRLASAESLRALNVLEKTLAALTPEFLQTRFQAQDRLATAWLSEVDAMVNYNSAMARLYHAMGTGLIMNRVEIDVVEPGP